MDLGAGASASAEAAPSAASRGANGAGMTDEAAPPPPIAVITTEGCPHCKRAKLALKDAGFQYSEFNMSSNLDALAELKRITSKSTVPQVFVGGSLVGGADDVVASLSDGTLKERVAAAADAPPLPEDLQALLGSASSAAAGGDTSAPVPLPRYLPGDMGTEEYTKLQELAGEMHMDTEHLKRRTLNTGLFSKGKALKGCFHGSDIVVWMVHKGLVATREEGVALGGRMMGAKLLRTVEKNGSGGSSSSGSEGFTDSGHGAYLQLTVDAMKPPMGKPLNTHISWDIDCRPAGQVAADLRHLIVSLYDKFLSPDGLGVDYEAMGEDPLFLHYVNSTAELQKVSLDDLSREELMAFFINIYNALIVHATVVYGAPTSTVERVKWFGSLKYNVGGHEYSADDIEHGVLRGNRASPANLLVLIGLKQFAKGHFNPDNDPRAKYAVTPMDPRIHFALVCGAKSCPPIRVYSPESLDQGLEAAASAFCEGSVLVDKAKNSVDMSMILKWYGGDFGETMTTRLEAIAKFLPPSTAEDLRSMLKGPQEPKVTYPPYNWDVNKK